MAKNRYRRGEPDSSPDKKVLRGGDFSEEKLRNDACRNHEIYGFYGISVFAADDLASKNELLRTTFLNSPEVVEIRNQALGTAGLSLDDTGINPRHYDIVHNDLDYLVTGLLSAENTVILNPFFNPEGGPE